MLLPSICNMLVPARGKTDRFSGVKRLKPIFSSIECIKSFKLASITSGSIEIPEKVSITRNVSPVRGKRMKNKTSNTIKIALSPLLKFSLRVRCLCCPITIRYSVAAPRKPLIYGRVYLNINNPNKIIKPTRIYLYFFLTESPSIIFLGIYTFKIFGYCKTTFNECFFCYFII